MGVFAFQSHGTVLVTSTGRTTVTRGPVMPVTTRPRTAPVVGDIDDQSTAQTVNAVAYLRVSTEEQATRGGRDEGFSIPAQREAIRRLAADQHAVLVQEFVDAGKSGTSSARRPALQDMLAYIKTHPVQICYVHKLDRLARNLEDDVAITMVLRQRGVKLVSVTENIDDTAHGSLVHGIMAVIAEFYSRNLATEVSKGLTQKARSGGTVTRAPIGYFNVRKRDEQGREYRTVEVDPARAPLVTWAFETYATGAWSLSALAGELALRGLATVPTPKMPSRPISTQTLQKMLRNPYYKGEIVYKGARHMGTHDPLINSLTWGLVQDTLDARNLAGGTHPIPRPLPERLPVLRLRGEDERQHGHQPSRRDIPLLHLPRPSPEEHPLRQASHQRRHHRETGRRPLQDHPDQPRGVPGTRRHDLRDLRPHRPRSSPASTPNPNTNASPCASRKKNLKPNN